MADIKKRTNAAAASDFDSDVKGKGKQKAGDPYDPLSVLDEDGEAEPLDNEGQFRTLSLAKPARWRCIERSRS